MSQKPDAAEERAYDLIQKFLDNAEETRNGVEKRLSTAEEKLGRQDERIKALEEWRKWLLGLAAAALVTAGGALWTSHLRSTESRAEVPPPAPTTVPGHPGE